jgi:hypothetical protein
MLCKPIKRTSLNNNDAYTLVEVLIAFFLFIAVAVPMISWIFTNNVSLRSQEMLVAQWLLEQEASELCLFPDRIKDQKKIKIDNKEWIIRAEKNGSPLVQYHLIGLKGSKRCGELYFYAYTK